METPPEIPKEFANKPELKLVWGGLVISISEGFMSRKQAYEMLADMDKQQGREPQNVYNLDDYRPDDSPQAA